MGSRSRALRFMGILASGLASCAGASADTLRATYEITLLGVVIGTGKVKADITPTSYVVEASAKLSGVGAMVSNSRGASIGKGAIVAGHILPASFATTASNASMTRTVQMTMSDNAVGLVHIEPPFEEKPDRIPLSDKDKHGVLDPVGAFVIPAPAQGPATSPAACERVIPVFDGYTRFDISLSYVGQRKVATKGYSGPVAVCAARYTPIAGHRRDRPGTKFMAENKDIEVWLAPVGEKTLWPFRVSVRTMIGTAIAEATEFSVAAK